VDIAQHQATRQLLAVRPLGPPCWQPGCRQRIRKGDADMVGLGRAAAGNLRPRIGKIAGDFGGVS
jgi:hypothetical protein